MIPWIPATTLAAPFEIVWTVSFAGGLSTQRIEWDWYGEDMTLQLMGKIGIHVWDQVVAPLLSRTARLELCTATLLRPPFIFAPVIAPDSHGHQLHAEGHPSEAAVWVTHTSETDRWARRPFFFPGTPARWVNAGVLTDEAVNAHLTFCRAAMLGLGGLYLPSALRAIRFHPGEGDSFPEAPKVPSWRPITHWRVMTHCDRPPEGAL